VHEQVVTVQLGDTRAECGVDRGTRSVDFKQALQLAAVRETPVVARPKKVLSFTITVA
jgi:hypothetical protein